MAKLHDLPVLFDEFTTMAKEYLLQETVEPAKKLGRFAGLSLGAAILWAIAILLLSVAGVRALIDVLPEGAYWEALGYLIWVLALVALAAIVVRLGPRSESDDTGGAS
jgi:hypothetical protein